MEPEGDPGEEDEEGEEEREGVGPFQEHHDGQERRGRCGLLGQGGLLVGEALEVKAAGPPRIRHADRPREKRRNPTEFIIQISDDALRLHT